LAACSAIARSGERCKGVAIDGSGLCYAHHPDHAGARRRAAQKGGKRGGRGRPVAELSSLKQRFEELAEDVLNGRVDKGDAAVAGQLWNYAIGAVRTALKAKEVEELEERLSELEAALEGREKERGYGYKG
jgi:glutathione S-transferase